MDKITDVTAEDCGKSPYVRPFRLCYKQNGVPKTWDVVKAFNSVCIVVFNVTRKVIIMVRQFRPGVYYAAIDSKDQCGPVDSSRYPGCLGVTLELCAGLVDKDLPVEQIAREEVLEECGYNVRPTCMHQVVTCKSSVGVSGSEVTMFYAEVTDEDRVTSGGGCAKEGECIEVVEMTIPEVRQYLLQNEVRSPIGLLYGLAWFLQHKAPTFECSG